MASLQNPDDGASNISDASVEYLPTLPVQKYTQNLTSQNYFNKKGTKKINSMELNWPSLLKNSSVQKIKMLWKHLSPNKVQLLLLLTLDRIVSVCNMACPTASNMQNIAKTRSREEGVTPPL